MNHESSRSHSVFTCTVEGKVGQPLSKSTPKASSQPFPFRYLCLEGGKPEAQSLPHFVDFRCTHSH